MDALPLSVVGTYVFVFGAIVGSFLNVCIYRLPREKSIVAPRSRCPHCNTIVPWFLNVPIASWFFLRGKTACCRQPLSARYPCVESLTAFVAWSLWYCFDARMAFGYFVFLAFLTIAFFVDLDFQIIPDEVTLLGTLLGIILSFLAPQIQGVQNNFLGIGLSLKGACLGSGILLWIAIVSEYILKKETMGMGDIKLMGCVGAFTGWQGCIFSIFIGAVLGTLIYVPLILAASIKERSLKPSLSFNSQIPFGPFLSLACGLYVFYGNKHFLSYLEEIGTLLSYGR